jgi:hypothetical protein
MRAPVGSLAFAGLLAAAAHAVSAKPPAVDLTPQPAVAVQLVEGARPSRDPGIMVLVGAAMISLAAALRRST